VSKRQIQLKNEEIKKSNLIKNEGKSSDISVAPKVVDKKPKKPDNRVKQIAEKDPIKLNGNIIKENESVVDVRGLETKEEKDLKNEQILIPMEVTAPQPATLLDLNFENTLPVAEPAPVQEPALDAISTPVLIPTSVPAVQIIVPSAPELPEVQSLVPVSQFLVDVENAPDASNKGRFILCI